MARKILVDLFCHNQKRKKCGTERVKDH